MVQFRRARILEVRDERPGAVRCVVEIDGDRAEALAYPGLTGPVATGDVVIVNTTAVALGLGTGGLHLVMAIEGAERRDHPGGHAMKLRYTPAQTSVDAVEELHRERIDAVETLDGMPVVAAGLHSAMPAAAIGVRAARERARIAYVMTDGAALHAGFSEAIARARSTGLIDVTITAGQSVGGDLEAVTLHGALAASRAVAEADVAIVAMGPGNLGTGSRWGFALLEVAGIIDAADAMGARAIVVPRVSFADERARHQGISHHTLTALRVARADAVVTVPVLSREQSDAVHAALRALGRHTIVEVDTSPAEEALATSSVPLRSMGRSFADDPDAFRAAAAAGLHAVTLLG